MITRNLNRAVLAMLISSFALSAGCSGSGSTPSGIPDSSTSPPPPPPVMLAPQPGLVPATQVQAGGVRKQETAAPKAAAKPAREITSNLFAVMSSHEDLDLQPPDRASLRDEFESYAPTTGMTYSNVSVVWPEGSPAARTNRSEVSNDPRLPEGFSVVIPAEASSGQLPPRIRCDLDGSEMVLVPVGVFLQGTDHGPDDCGPQHPAYVSSFYIDVTEVTLNQFEKFQQRQKELKKGTLPQPINADRDPGQPVLGISWRDADLYARQLGKVLPTESEWEKAARGIHGLNYPWGNSRPAWNEPRHSGQITTVGKYSADHSPFGAFDMAGNAREWVADWYSPETYKSAHEKDGSPIRNSKGVPRAEVVGQKVVKGAKSGWEVWQRDHAHMRDGYSDIGFRCALRVPEVASTGDSAAIQSDSRVPLKPEAVTSPAQRPASGF